MVLVVSGGDGGDAAACSYMYVSQNTCSSFVGSFHHQLMLLSLATAWLWHGYGMHSWMQVFPGHCSDCYGHYLAVVAILASVLRC